jgi:hypothetical protein
VRRGGPMVDKEVVFKTNDMIIGQTDDMWKIAAGIIILQVGMIAHVIYSLRVDIRESVVSWFLSMSILSHVLSLMFGYFAKGALILGMIEYASTGNWTLNTLARTMNLLQILSLTAGLVVFAIVFAFYSKVLARALVKVRGK